MAGKRSSSRKPAETASEIREVAQEAAQYAKDVATSAASQANEKVQRLADRQISLGAEMVGRVSDAIRAAADRLDQDAPQLAPLAHGAADRLADLSGSLAERSATDILQETAGFARRNPALVFGATALGGFLLFRLLNASSSPGYAERSDEDDEDWERLEQDEELGAYAPGAGADPVQGSTTRVSAATGEEHLHGA